MSFDQGESTETLRAVADAFCRNLGIDRLEAWPTGAEGLRKLAAALDEICERIDDGQEDEDCVLEGGGALFACLLIGALGARATRAAERLVLRVGDYGYFDPFEAVRHALDDEWPSRALRQEVARAEAEALGSGPHARVVSEVVRQVHASTPFEFTSCDHDRVCFGDALEIALPPLLRVCSGEPSSDVEAAVARVVLSIPQARNSSTDWDALASRLFPRIVNLDFVDQMRSRGLVFEPFCADLSMAFVIQDGKMVRYVRQNEVPNALCARLRERAVANLEARSSSVRVRAYSDDPRASGQSCEGIYQLTYGDGFDASRLCLPALGPALSKRFGAQAAVAVPHRDALIAAQGKHFEKLRQVAQDAFERAPHALTRKLFRCGTQGLQTLN